MRDTLALAGSVFGIRRNMFDFTRNTMDIEEARAYCLSLPGATEDMPYGPNWVVFRVEGKIFLHIALERRLIAIKLAPERGEELRERYGAVRPAWHMNKRHWNDVDIEGTFSDATIKGLIAESYALVVAKLPKRLREKYEAAAQSVKE